MPTQIILPRDAKPRIVLHFSPQKAPCSFTLKWEIKENSRQPEANNYCEESPEDESVSNPTCPKLSEGMSPGALLAQELRLRESKGLRLQGRGIVTGRYIKKKTTLFVSSETEKSLSFPPQREQRLIRKGVCFPLPAPHNPVLSKPRQGFSIFSFFLCACLSQFLLFCEHNHSSERSFPNSQSQD